MKATMHLAGAAFLIGAWCMGQAASATAGRSSSSIRMATPPPKATIARLDPTLKPAQETRLRVGKEDLTIHFGGHRASATISKNSHLWSK